MKVLHVSRSLSCSDRGFYSQSLVLGMHRYGHRVAIAAPPGPLSDELTSGGVEVLTFPFLADARLEVFRKRAICSRVEDTSWDLIHGHGLSLEPLISRIATKLNLPYVLTLQGFQENPESMSTGSDRLSGLIAPNEALREHAVNDVGIPKQQVEVIHPGVNPDQLRVQPVLRSGMDPVIALGTSLDEKKRVRLFLDVAEAVSKGVETPTFLVLMQGPHETTMRREVRRRELENKVVFQSNPTAYFKVLPEIDVLLSTDPELELGIVILHAMGCGKPVITGGAGGAYHAVDDQETGCLVSLTGGAQEMIDRLQFLLQHPLEARRMGKRAREQVVECFSLDRMLDATTSFLSRSTDG